jgi:hypothetical protein
VDPAERVRTLLLRGDNLLKSERLERSLAAFEQAHEAALDPAVDPRVRDLVERRLETARSLAEGGGGS